MASLQEHQVTNAEARITHIYQNSYLSFVSLLIPLLVQASHLRCSSDLPDRSNLIIEEIRCKNIPTLGRKACWMDFQSSCIHKRPTWIEIPSLPRAVQRTRSAAAGEEYRFYIWDVENQLSVLLTRNGSTEKWNHVVWRMTWVIALGTSESWMRNISISHFCFGEASKEVGREGGGNVWESTGTVGWCLLIRTKVC